MGRRVLGTLLLLAGVGGVSIFGPGLVWAVRTAAAAGAAPMPTSVADAPARKWVRLTDAKVRCETVKSARGVHVAVATDAAGAHPFLTQLTDPEKCETARLEGLFLDERVTATRLKDAYGLDVSGTPDLRVLGPPVGWGFALLALAPVLVSAALGFGGWWLGWRSSGARTAPSMRSSQRPPIIRT
jgi:hypothetical protein